MKELIDWYWLHGIKRGTDENDPDKELRKISIGGWLDPLVTIVERNKYIHENINQKSCLALWGPSQTGKSTLMSRYIDGKLDDGSDSALTWDDSKKTRFSPPVNGMQAVPNGTLVFNPFNHQSDASGVATRYVLKSSVSDEVNPLYPVEIKLTNRAQIIQSLSLGYLSECYIDEERIDYLQETFLKELSGEPATAVSADAYSLLKDIANVIEFMRGERRFNNLFKRGEWHRKLRKALVSAPIMLSNYSMVENLMAKIFWDGNVRLTQTYRTMSKLLISLTEEWKNCKILASLEVGSLLLDIDSYKNYDAPSDSQGHIIKDKVSRLNYERINNEIHLFIDNRGSSISGDSFGYFQALCSELVVPLKKEILETVPEKGKFLNLVTKCDFLDFPGVSNKNTGENAVEENNSLIDLSQCSMSEVLTRVFKQGKTQCLVYNYVRRYGIDAFAILVRTNQYPSKSSLLNAGISEWIRSYNDEWEPGRTSVMPVFLNMTFFASLLNNVSMNGTGNGGLRPYIERIQGELTFATKESAIFFPTTYQQFHDGKIDNVAMQEMTINAIINDPVFIPSTGMSIEALNAVYLEDGGVNYMLDAIAKHINPEKRRDLCRRILEKDKAEFIRLIENQLPSTKELQQGARKAQINECNSLLQAAISRAEGENDTTKYCLYAKELNELFSAPSTVFEPIPRNAITQSKKEINAFIRQQIGNWYSYKISNLEESNIWSKESQQTILSALRDSFKEQELFELIHNQLGQLTNTELAEAARYPFTIAFNNILKTGTMNQQSQTCIEDRNPDKLDNYIEADFKMDSNHDDSPYYHTILKPVMDRLEQLAESASTGTRPSQPGDKELKQLYDQILASDNFRMC